MSKIATIPVFSSIVAILFFLNCQRWENNTLWYILQYKFIFFKFGNKIITNTIYKILFIYLILILYYLLIRIHKTNLSNIVECNYFKV